MTFIGFNQVMPVFLHMTVAILTSQVKHRFRRLFEQKLIPFRNLIYSICNCLTFVHACLHTSVHWKFSQFTDVIQNSWILLFPNRNTKQFIESLMSHSWPRPNDYLSSKKLAYSWKKLGKNLQILVWKCMKFECGWSSKMDEVHAVHVMHPALNILWKFWCAACVCEGVCIKQLSSVHRLDVWVCLLNELST